MQIRFLLLVLFLTGCNSIPQPKNANIKNDSIRIDSIQKIDNPSTADTFVKNSIDTAKYLNLPYYDTSMDHGSPPGYIDTFTIHNYKFRIVHQDMMSDGVVEKYQNGYWYRLMKFEELSYLNDYDISLDVDGDGYCDLIFCFKWSCEIHFFDTTKNEFCDTANCEIGRDWTLIDTSNHIFFENEFGKLMHSPVSSNLFTFKNTQRIELASFEVSFNEDIEDQNFINGYLILNGHSKPIEKFVPGEKVDVALFDYEKFWKERYKKIMHRR